VPQFSTIDSVLVYYPLWLKRFILIVKAFCISRRDAGPTAPNLTNAELGVPVMRTQIWSAGIMRRKLV
jgi:hypothetical protein